MSTKPTFQAVMNMGGAVLVWHAAGKWKTVVATADFVVHMNNNCSSMTALGM